MEFNLPFRIVDHGDGSAGAEFHPTKESAKMADAEDHTPYNDAVDSIRLRVDGAKLYFRDYQDGWVWIEVPQ